MSAKISIIIPAYNASKTVRRAVESALAQTLQDIEVWVVNDGSTDGTDAILDQLKCSDSRVNVIHQSNQGAYMARLSALQRIKTPYFTFIDADDSVMPQTYETALTIMLTKNLDVLRYDEFGSSDATGKVDVVSGTLKVYENVYIPWLVKGEGSATIWNMIYRNRFDFSCFKNLRITMFDDLAFNLQFLKNAYSYGYLHLGLYNYSCVEGSAVHSFTDRHIHDFKKIIEFRAVNISNKTENAIWILKNTYGMIISASMSNARLHARIKNVRKILEMAEVRHVLTGRNYNAYYFFVWVIKILPMAIVVSMVKFLAIIKSMKRG